MSQEAEIADMLDALGADGEEAPDTGAESEASEGEKPAGEEEEAVEEESEEELEGLEGDSEASEEEPDPDTDDDPSDEIAQLKALNKDLMQQVNQMTSAFVNVSGAQALSQAQTEAGDSKEKEALPDLTGDLLTEDEQDSLIDNPEILNKAFGRFVERITEALKHVQSTTSASVEASVSATVAAQKTADDFYSKNPDLSTPVLKPFVKTVFSQKAAEAKAGAVPKTNKQLLEETAKTVRESLGLKKPKTTRKSSPSKKGKGKKPTMPGSKTGRKGKAKKDSERTDQQSFMDELIS